jgi:predicted GTPase
MTKESDIAILKRVEETFDAKYNEIVESVKNANDEAVSISYGFAPAWRDWFSSELDEDVNYKLSDDAQESVYFLFEELESKLGKKDIIIWGDEGDGTVMWVGTAKAYNKMYPEEELA